MVYYMSKETVALFVLDLLTDFVNDLQSIMTTRQEKSGAYCVSIATSTSSEDAVKEWVQKNYGLLTSTSPENIPVG